MVRKAKPRKTGATTKEAMDRAVNFVSEKVYSLSNAADMCGLKHQTLARYVKKKKEIQDDTDVNMTQNYAARQVLSPELERMLTEYLNRCSKMAYDLSTQAVQKLAYDFASSTYSVPPSWCHLPECVQESQISTLDSEIIADTHELSSNSHTNIGITTPESIIALPRKANCKSRQKGRSTIITSTPEKEALIAKARRQISQQTKINLKELASCSTDSVTKFQITRKRKIKEISDEDDQVVLVEGKAIRQVESDSSSVSKISNQNELEYGVNKTHLSDTLSNL
ncbi:hypothetical protein ILUMI_10936 [Ignelater luminosus]|uniref:HTH psq-type domain-containing protein n=1 Tax=Ignelater luminosus TaxID=2038154 RepID=A0A8K0D616_IGNLU|nr:hypothetical protein ILUMI_10936 [Ignelater luminosus]